MMLTKALMAASCLQYNIIDTEEMPTSIHALSLGALQHCCKNQFHSRIIDCAAASLLCLKPLAPHPCLKPLKLKVPVSVLYGTSSRSKRYILSAGSQPWLSVIMRYLSSQPCTRRTHALSMSDLSRDLQGSCRLAERDATSLAGYRKYLCN